MAIVFGIFGISLIVAIFLVFAGNVVRLTLVDILAVVFCSVLTMLAWQMVAPVHDDMLRLIGFVLCLVVMMALIRLCRTYPQVDMSLTTIRHRMQRWQSQRMKRAQVRRRIYTVETERV